MTSTEANHASLTPHRNKSVLLISSQVIRGTVGSRASAFALETLGFNVWSMITVSMTWHPGQGKAHRMIIPPADFNAFANDIITSPHTAELDAVMTGYFASPEQVEITARLIKKLKEKQPGIVYLCDPVMADEDGLYIEQNIAKAICQHLIPQADIIKPNRSELEWICNQEFTTNDEIIATAARFAPATMLVTSAPALLKNAIANLLITPQQALLAEHRALRNPVNGLGDLTSALFLSHILQGDSMEKALQLTTAAVFDCLASALQNDSNELQLENTYTHFTQPMTRVDIRQIVSSTKTA